MSKQCYPIDYACTVIIVKLFIELKNNPLTNPRVSDKLVLPSFSTGDEVDERRQRVATDNRELKFERDSSGENTFIYIYIFDDFTGDDGRNPRYAVGGNLKVEATSGHTGTITQYLLSRGTIYRSA